MQTTRQTMRTDLDSIGEILIEFYYIKNIRPKSGDATHSMATTGLVSEKALKVKALSHEARCVFITSHINNALIYR